ncbi:MAG: ABC transporter ATP-binding protein [Acidobacteria bacterium]|nr:ABC transporter ATP-binding protein [Acidobacteriota bacterium]
MSESTLLEARRLVKAYRARRGGTDVVHVLQDVNLMLMPGDAVAVQGESGTGKTTLLNLLGGLDRPDSGVLLHKGQPLPPDPAARARWRRREVGFIFQFHGLLREFTAEENIALAGHIAGAARRESLRRARSLLERLGLAGRAHHYPDELSGGEQQRVAVARALFSEPSIVLADEPTGNLDPTTGDRVLDLLFELHASLRFALVVATHSTRLAQRCSLQARLQGGQLHLTRSGEQPDAPSTDGKVVVVNR